jgi:hypothetical protein
MAGFKVTAEAVRNRTMKVGRRLQKSADVLTKAAPSGPCNELIVGFNGGCVRNRHKRPERNFEVVADKPLDSAGHATRFAIVRNGGLGAARTVGRTLQKCRVNEATSVTALTDGDAGLRAIHQQVAPQVRIPVDVGR